VKQSLLISCVGATRLQRGLSDVNTPKMPDNSSVAYVVTTFGGDSNNTHTLTAEEVYNYPDCVMNILAQIPGIKYVPYMPKVEFNADRKVNKVAEVLSALQSI
jgi:hypothetical protein